MIVSAEGHWYLIKINSELLDNKITDTKTIIAHSRNEEEIRNHCEILNRLEKWHFVSYQVVKGGYIS